MTIFGTSAYELAVDMALQKRELARQYRAARRAGVAWAARQRAHAWRLLRSEQRAAEHVTWI